MTRKYKVVTWFDTDQLRKLCGIKIQLETKGKWYNAYENNEALFFSTKEEALTKIQQLKLSEV